MKPPFFTICSILALAVTASVQGQYDYKFMPTSTDYPPLGDWGGILDLDASSSSGGSLSDINETDSYLKTPFGTFALSQSTDIISHGPLTWNSAAIENMDITGIVTLGKVTGYDWTITADSLTIQAPDPLSPQASGPWFRTVSDSTSTALLIGLAVSGLCAFEYLGRNRQMAKVRR
jgi:hypothetical protein